MTPIGLYFFDLSMYLKKWVFLYLITLYVWFEYWSLQIQFQIQMQLITQNIWFEHIVLIIKEILF